MCDDDMEPALYDAMYSDIDEASSNMMDLHIRTVAAAIKAWDHEKISVLMEWLDRLNALCDMSDTPFCLHVDISELPSEPMPEGITMYPIWACDRHGMCLVGSDMGEIEPLDNIIRYYEERKTHNNHDE